MNAYLRADNLEVTIGRGRSNERSVLTECGIQVQEGRVHGLVGPRGSGKSMLARCIAGLLPRDAAISGSLIIRGSDILAVPADVRAATLRRVAYLPPNGRNILNPTTTVGDLVALVARSHQRLGRRQARDVALQTLQRVGLPDPERTAKAYPHELSGGMAQRVAVAIVFSYSPEFLIVDEMTANLDVTVQAQLLDTTKALVDESGLTVLYITRDLGIVANYCDEVSVIIDGQVKETQTAKEFFNLPITNEGRQLLDAARIEISSRNRKPSSFRLSDLGEYQVGTESTFDGQSADARSAPLLSVRGLIKHYRSFRSHLRVHAVNGVDLEIYPGETLGLVGESGSGKTTVGRCAVGLVEPTGGEIRIDNKVVNPAAFRQDIELRRKVQLVFQEPQDSLNPRWTVGRILADPLRRLLDYDSAKIKATVTELLELVNLPQSVLDSYPHQLPSGVQQLVGIARAMAPLPKLIVLDEPTSRLDTVDRLQVIRALDSIQKQTNVSYLFISHDLQAIRHIATRVAVMYLGRIFEEGGCEEIFSRPAHPYSCALLSAALDPYVDRAKQRFGLRGEIPGATVLPSGCFLHPRCPVATAKCTHEWPPLVELDRRGHSAGCLRLGASEGWTGWELLGAEEPARRLQPNTARNAR